MKLSIIIPTKDRGEIFNQTLCFAYLAIAGIESEIIVVNDSKNNQIVIASKYKDKVTVVNNPKSGVASARNFGAAQAKSELLLFLDDDMLISAENIQTTIQLHQTYSNCCINLNWIYPPALSEQIRKNQFGRYLITYEFTSLKGWNKGEFWDDSNLFATNGITSQYLSINKKSFIEAGGYNESFPHAGFEDFDFAQRLKQRNFRFYIYPGSMVFHNEVDRTELNTWLARKKRGGETRQVAINMGYNQLHIQYNFVKVFILKLTNTCNTALLHLLKFIPNIKAFDFIYYKVINLLLAAAIFEGYHKRD